MYKWTPLPLITNPDNPDKKYMIFVNNTYDFDDVDEDFICLKNRCILIPKGKTIRQEILDTFINEIEAINDYSHETGEAEIVRKLLGDEKPSQHEIENSKKLTNLKITDEVKDALETLANELETNYQKILFIKYEADKATIKSIVSKIYKEREERVKSRDIKTYRLNYEFLEQLAIQIRVYHLYFKLLNRVKRKSRRDTQTLTKYVNSLEIVHDVTLNLNLKNEIEKEISFYKSVDTNFINSNGYIYAISKERTYSQDTNGNPYLASTKEANKLERYIKMVISKLPTAKTYY